MESQGFSCNHDLFLGFLDLTLAGFFTPNVSLTLSLFHPLLGLGWFLSLQELLGLPLLRCLLCAVVQSSDFHVKVQIGQTLGGCSWTVLLKAKRSLSPLGGVVATLDMLVQGQTPQGEALRLPLYQRRAPLVLLKVGQNVKSGRGDIIKEYFSRGE